MPPSSRRRESNYEPRTQPRGRRGGLQRSARGAERTPPAVARLHRLWICRRRSCPHPFQLGGPGVEVFHQRTPERVGRRREAGDLHLLRTMAGSTIPAVGSLFGRSGCTRERLSVGSHGRPSRLTNRQRRHGRNQVGFAIPQDAPAAATDMGNLSGPLHPFKRPAAHVQETRRLVRFQKLRIKIRGVVCRRGCLPICFHFQYLHRNRLRVAIVGRDATLRCSNAPFDAEGVRVKTERNY